MNKMQTVYNQQADLYDELVYHEDYCSNLFRTLNSIVDFSKKTVCEFGVGTGRVTKQYIDKVKSADLFDNSVHMLEKAKSNLEEHMNKISIKELDNKDIELITSDYDISIEGWSFGHLICDYENDINYWAMKLINNLKRISKKIIIIETYGTNIEEAKAPNIRLELFYKKLKEAGFKEYIIRTDYKFETTEKAQIVLGSFFGKNMEENIKEYSKTVIKEFTGIWIL